MILRVSDIPVPLKKTERYHDFEGVGIHKQSFRGGKENFKSQVS